MRTLCIIPARGGSKRLPRKNIQPLGGKPLLAHSIEQARVATSVQKVVVSTEDSEIAAVTERFGAEVVWRPAELASDTAGSLPVLLHALEHVEASGFSPEAVVFLQCTSPLRRPGDIDGAVAAFQAAGVDCLFSACVSHACIWQDTPQGLRSLTYDYHVRQREQDWPRQYRENGSIYVVKPRVLREETGNWLAGRVGVYEMDYWSSFQIDLLEDIELCEWVLQYKLAGAAAAR